MSSSSSGTPPVGLFHRFSDVTRRTAHVGLVALRHGFGHVIEQLGLMNWLPRRQRHERAVDAETAGQEPAIRLRRALAELGPTYVKLGQMLSARSDLMPAEYVAELRKLQDEVPPVDFDEVADVISQELGHPVDALFREFEREPRASASIGQVHWAVLQSGEAVAVKVQRPHIERDIETDLAVLRLMASEGEKRIGWCRRMRLVELCDEFALKLRAELNYTTEGHNTERLRRNTSEVDGVHVPAVFWGLTTSRVLTLERIEGIRIADVQRQEDGRVDRRECAALLAQSIVRQIIVDGYFHADPHAGNVFVLPPADIAFLDCGSVGWLGRERREQLSSLLGATLSENARSMCDEIVQMGGVGENTDVRALEEDIDLLLARYHDARSGEVRIGTVLQDLMKLLFRHEVRLPSEMALVLKTLILTDGTCLVLDPTFDFREATATLARELRLRLPSARELAADLRRLARDFRRYAGALPRQMNQLFNRVEAGNLKVKIEYDQIERPMSRLDMIANRLSFSIVVSAIILASALLLQSERGLQIHGFPLPAVVGLGVGGVMGLWLLYSILRSGRL